MVLGATTSGTVVLSVVSCAGMSHASAHTMGNRKTAGRISLHRIARQVPRSGSNLPSGPSIAHAGCGISKEQVIIHRLEVLSHVLYGTLMLVLIGQPMRDRRSHDNELQGPDIPVPRFSPPPFSDASRTNRGANPKNPRCDGCSPIAYGIPQLGYE